MRKKVSGTIKTRQPCKDDIAKFCKDAQPAHGAVAKCLKEHERELFARYSQKIKVLKNTD